MKKVLFVLCLLCTTGAFAQYIGGSRTLSAQPQSYSFPSNPAHATYAPMAAELSVLSNSSYTAAQGDRPASDFPQAEAASLGLIARELKKEHDALPKKSHVVWINQ
jgi:hypothetical protein